MSIFKKLDAVIIPCTSFGKNPFEKCAKRTVIVDNLPDAGRHSRAGKIYRTRRTPSAMSAA